MYKVLAIDKNLRLERNKFPVNVPYPTGSIEILFHLRNRQKQTHTSYFTTATREMN